MTDTLNNQFFFVAPLEVVKVTKDNLEEAAKWCGGQVHQVASRRVEGRIDSYVWVPTPKGTQISWAFPGMFITRRIVVTLKDELAYSYQVYKRDYFQRNYFGTPNEAVDKTWERAEKERAKARKEAAVAPAKKKAPAPDIAKMMGQGNVTKEQHAETMARQAVEVDNANDEIPAEVIVEQGLVQENRVKQRRLIRTVEDTPLPAPPASADIAGVPVAPAEYDGVLDDAQSLGEAVALVEQELGGRVIENGTIESVNLVAEDPNPATGVQAIEIVDTEGPEDGIGSSVPLEASMAQDEQVEPAPTVGTENLRGL